VNQPRLVGKAVKSAPAMNGKRRAAPRINKTLTVTNLEEFILFSNVRRQPPLPVARSVPGAKRPSTERDAGRGWLDGMVRLVLSIFLMMENIRIKSVKCSNSGIGKPWDVSIDNSCV
jgi:hypothetical protein